MRIFPFIVLLLAASGCAHFPTEMTGQFNARQGDFIVVGEDGSLFWSPPSTTQIYPGGVGVLEPNKKDPGFARVVLPSTSPFVDCTVRFLTNDYSQVTVDWGKYSGKAGLNHSTVYTRVRSK